MAAQQRLSDFVKSLSSGAPAFSGTNVQQDIQEFITKMHMFVAIGGVDPAAPTTVVAVATRLEGAASAWWSQLNPRPQTLDEFLAALTARFLPANWAMSAAIGIVDLRAANTVADVPRLIAAFQAALTQLPPQTTASASAFVLLLALFTSKLPLDLQKDLRTRPPQSLAEAITAVQSAVAVSAPRMPAQGARQVAINAHAFAGPARRPTGSRGRGAGPGPRPGPRPAIDGNPLLPARPGPPRRPNGVTDAEYTVRLAEGLCVGCGADDHLFRQCPIKLRDFYSRVRVRVDAATEKNKKQTATPLQTVVRPSPPQPARKVVQPKLGLSYCKTHSYHLAFLHHQSAPLRNLYLSPRLSSRGSLSTRPPSNQTLLSPPSQNPTSLLLLAHLHPQLHLLASLPSPLHLSHRPPPLSLLHPLPLLSLLLSPLATIPPSAPTCMHWTTRSCP